MIIESKCHVFGDNIDTDRIIPGKYTKTLDLLSLAKHCMEDIDPQFSEKFTAGEIIVAGKNFGCGSSREQAPLALKTVGASCIIADYFARIFFRNAINIGLPVLEIGHHNIQNGDELYVDLKNGIVKNIRDNKIYQSTKMPEVMVQILNSGGLVNYLKENKDYKI